jgi:hypothetical protein
MTQPAQGTGEWAGVLEVIRKTIEATLTEALTREEPSPDGKPELPSWPVLSEAADRIGRLNHFSDAARARQTQPARELAEREERLRRWLGDAETARRRLAEWASQSLG